MARYSESFAHLIEKEEKLINIKEELDNSIVHVLYKLEVVKGEEYDITEKRLSKLKEDLEIVKRDLKTTRASLRRYILRLFDDIDN